MKISIVIGEKDHVVPIEYREKFKELISNYNLNYKLIEYDGDHRIIENVLIEYVKTI